MRLLFSFQCGRLYRLLLRLLFEEPELNTLDSRAPLFERDNQNFQKARKKFSPGTEGEELKDNVHIYNWDWYSR